MESPPEVLIRPLFNAGFSNSLTVFKNLDGFEAVFLDEVVLVFGLIHSEQIRLG